MDFGQATDTKGTALPLVRTGRLGSVRLAPARIEDLKRKLGLASGERLRLAYLPGPFGGTAAYRSWKKHCFNPNFPSLDYPTQFYDLAEALDAEALVATDEPLMDLGDGEAERVRFIPTKLGGLPSSMPQRIPELMRRSRRLLKEVAAFKPHATIIAENIDFFSIGVLPGKRILALHNNYWRADQSLPNPLGMVTSADVLLALRTSLDAVLAVSPEGLRQTRILAGPNMPCRQSLLQSLEDTPKTIAPFPEVPKILFVGRAVEAKGVDDLFAAWRILAERHPKLELTILGHGDAADRVRAAVEAEGLGDRVRLPGRVPWDEVQKELDSASLLACPTRPGHLEGQPRTILEAHMHGRPVVASSVCDTDAKVLTLFHQPCNPQSLAEALETALFDEEVRDGLRKAASEGREAYHNRTLSWGTQLFELMLESA